MKCGIDINILKRATKVLLLFVVISLQGDFEADSVHNIVRPEFKPMVSKPRLYISNGSLEHVTFQAQKSQEDTATITRNGVFVSRNNAPATVLICHGYMCDKYDISFIRTVFSDYNVMTFDFRAHGENIDDQLCTFGKDEPFDVIGAVNYLKTRPEVQGKPLIAYGFSMGAVSAIEAQSKVNSLFDGMILDCPFDSSENLLKKGLAQLKINLFGYEIGLPGRKLLQRYAYNPYVQSMLKAILKTLAKMDGLQINTQIKPVSPVDSIEAVSVPCYFITCKNDEKVSVEAVTSVYAGAKGYKRLRITNGRRHFDSFFYNPEQYIAETNEFVKDVIAGKFNNDTSAQIVADPDEGTMHVADMVHHSVAAQILPDQAVKNIQ